MKHKFPISLCTILGLYHLSPAQVISSYDTVSEEEPFSEDSIDLTIGSERFLWQSVFAYPYIIPEGKSVFNPTEKDDTELQLLKSKYFSLSLPLTHIRVTSPFGMRNHPVLKEYRNHLGVDLRANYQATYAMMSGVVERVGCDDASGKFVVCRHGKYSVYYYHLSEIKVTKGQKLKAGDIIGITGNTGRSTGAHLHLGVQYCGKYIDPMIFLVQIQRTKIALLKQIVEYNRRRN